MSWGCWEASGWEGQLEGWLGASALFTAAGLGASLPCFPSWTSKVSTESPRGVQSLCGPHCAWIWSGWCSLEAGMGGRVALPGGVW